MERMMNIVILVVVLFVSIILFMVVSTPLHNIFVTLGDVSQEGSVKENVTNFGYQFDNVYSIAGALIIIGVAIAIFLAVAVEKKRYNEYERYGGDYDYENRYY